MLIFTRRVCLARVAAAGAGKEVEFCGVAFATPGSGEGYKDGQLSRQLKGVGFCVNSAAWGARMDHALLAAVPPIPR